jgi:mRNA-degrading endonuclease HigB of HigAB toxin-antitoxin module
MVDTPKELDVKESLNLTDRIEKLLIGGCKKKLTESKVAKTILKQINAIDKFALPSWGAKNYVSSNDSIQFDVRGSKFRGRVIITYDKRSDNYIIELGQVRGMDWKQKYMMKSIFAQDLVNVLDQQVG